MRLSPAKIVSIKVDKENGRVSVYLKPDQVSLAIGKGGLNIKLASRLVGYEIDVFRELAEGQSEEDVDLSEFGDEIENWVIDELNRIGLGYRQECAGSFQRRIGSTNRPGRRNS